jgi:hypothetical protein
MLVSATVWLQTRRAAKAVGSSLQVVILFFIVAAAVAASAYQFGKKAPQKNELDDLKRRIDQLQERVSKPVLVPAAPPVANKPPG